MATRLLITLDSAERSALTKLSQKELRDPRDQLRLILRQELERQGLLLSNDGRLHQENQEALHE